MNWIKCKNESEKLQTIKDYCLSQIKENERQIRWYEAEESYLAEIHELKVLNRRFETILNIIAADSTTSVLVQ